MISDEDDIDDAIKNLQDSLDNPSVGSTRLIAKYDQIKAECRDDPAKRLRVIDVMVEQGCTREDAIEWIDRRE